MELTNRCKEHPQKEVSLICKNKDCKYESICTKCMPKHPGHDLIDIEVFWEGKIREMENNKEELIIPKKLRILNKNIKEKISTIETTNELKKEIIRWGEELQRDMKREIERTVRGLVKALEGNIGSATNDIISQTTSLHILNSMLGERREHLGSLKQAVEYKSYDLAGELSALEEEAVLRDHLLGIQPVERDIPQIKEIVKKEGMELKEALISTFNLAQGKLQQGIKEFYPREREIDQIVSASDDRSIIFWNADGTLNHTHKGELRYFSLLELSTGNIAAAADKNIEIIDRKKGIVLRTLRGHADCIGCIQELSSGVLVTGSQDSTIRIWDLDKNITLRVLKQHTDCVFCVKEHSSGQLLSGSMDHSVCVWNPKKGDLLSQHKDYNTANIWNFEELPNNLILSVCYDNESKELGLKIWELEGDTLINIPPPKEAPFGFLASCLLSGGKVVLGSGSQGGNILIFDVESAHFLNAHSVHEDAIWQIREGKEGEIITCSSDKSLKLIDVHTGEVITTYIAHQDEVDSVIVLFKE